LDRFEVGVSTAATFESIAAFDFQAAVVGAGNAAGQGAVFLAGHAARCSCWCAATISTRACRATWPGASSRTPNIEVLYDHDRAADIRRHAREVGRVHQQQDGGEATLTTPALFSFIGAVPRTDWLPPEIDRDPKGFVLTGAAAAQSSHWTARRTPSPGDQPPRCVRRR